MFWKHGLFKTSKSSPNALVTHFRASIFGSKMLSRCTFQIMHGWLVGRLTSAVSKIKPVTNWNGQTNDRPTNRRQQQRQTDDDEVLRNYGTDTDRQPTECVRLVVIGAAPRAGFFLLPAATNGYWTADFSTSNSKQISFAIISAVDLAGFIRS